MKTRLEWQPYVDDIAARMRLGHWEIRVREDPPESDDALAVVIPWYGRHAASIHLSDNFLSGDPRDQRYVVVHELVHCYFAHQDQLLQDNFSRDSGEAYRLASEYAVDSVAVALAQYMPLPEAS